MASRLLKSFVVVLWFLSPAELLAQPSASRPALETQASFTRGRITGSVEDERGTALSGVDVYAIGAIVAFTATDAAGRFSVSLPPGRYVVRAARPGYLQARDEIVQVGAARGLERRITLLKEGEAQPATEAPQPSAIAWRLRHLPRTVLRDEAHGPDVTADGTSEPFTPTNREQPGGALDAVSAFFADTPFTGQVNLFTTTPMPSSDGAATPRARGIAEFLIGAPVGNAGTWNVRGALSSGVSSAWIVLGEYVARADQPHGLNVAIAYRSQGDESGDPVLHPLPAEPRTNAAVRVANRWRVAPWLEVKHAVRFDRDDMISASALFSPTVSVRAELVPRTSVTASASQAVRTPGTSALLPASAARPWETPLEAVSPTSTWRGLPVPERVQQIWIGAERELGGTAVAHVEWFSQQVEDQLAMAFGTRASGRPDQYDVWSVGDLVVTGWRVGALGALFDHAQGAIEVVSAEGRWLSSPSDAAVRWRDPTGNDRVLQVRMALTWTVPRTATVLAVTHRMSAVRALDQHATSEPLRRQHVAVEFQQRSPFQPLDSGVVSLFFAVRTALADDQVSSYDDLLTSRTPARVTGGLQIQF